MSSGSEDFELCLSLDARNSRRFIDAITCIYNDKCHIVELFTFGTELHIRSENTSTQISCRRVIKNISLDVPIEPLGKFVRRCKPKPKHNIDIFVNDKGSLLQIKFYNETCENIITIPSFCRDEDDTVDTNPKEILCEETIEILCEETIADEPQCKICMEHKVNIALIPCGHSLCSCCVAASENCPFCRTVIKTKQRIFLS